MITSEKITSITNALIKFKREMPKINRSFTNEVYGSKYAKLGNIIEAINEPLLNAGLVLIQTISADDVLTTRLIHKSGQWIEANYNLNPTKQDVHTKGATITYMRRYAIASILGLNIDDDDDGNAAAEKKPKKSTKDIIEERKEEITKCNVDNKIFEAVEKEENEWKDDCPFDIIEHCLSSRYVIKDPEYIRKAYDKYKLNKARESGKQSVREPEKEKGVMTRILAHKPSLLEACMLEEEKMLADGKKFYIVDYLSDIYAISPDMADLLNLSYKNYKKKRSYDIRPK